MDNALDAVEARSRKAHSTLAFVQQKLELEFSSTYEDSENSLKILSRIKKLQEELPLVGKECSASKEELVDTVRESLASNRTLLRSLQARSGLPVEDDAADAVFSSFTSGGFRVPGLVSEAGTRICRNAAAASWCSTARAGRGLAGAVSYKNAAAAAARAGKGVRRGVAGAVSNRSAAAAVAAGEAGKGVAGAMSNNSYAAADADTPIARKRVPCAGVTCTRALSDRNAAAVAKAGNARKGVTCARAMSNTKRQSNAKKRQMQLHLVRGSLLPAADADVAGRLPVMEAEVWRRLPEELIWEVLRFVPAADYFRLQLVSRQWRQRLTSGDLRSRVVQPPVVACATPGGAFARGDHTSDSSNKVVVVDVDLASFVPSSLWKSDGGSYPYEVVVAADGLVCIRSNTGDSDDRKFLSDKYNYCVLNPVTRTCKVLPKIPLDWWGWLPPTPTALTVYGYMLGAGIDDMGCDIRREGQLHVATYDLTASGSGRWELAAACKPDGKPPRWLAPQLVLCAGETVWLCGDRVHLVLMPRPGEGSAVEIQVEQPSLEMLGLDPSRRAGHCCWLLGHRAAIYFLMSVNVRMCERRDVLMGVWRLARERLEWELVARLDVADVVRLTGMKRSEVMGRQMSHFSLECASGVREFLYCTVRVGDDGWRLVLVGFNLDTGVWELVHPGKGLFYDGVWYQSPSSSYPSVCYPYEFDVSSPLELRLDLFV